MKTRIRLLFVSLLIVWGCGQKSHNHEDFDQEAGDAIEEGGNQALLNEVDKLHNELMMQMEDVYKQKESLKSKLTSTQNLANEQKLKIEAAIAKLDSADASMMDWMHHFKPLADSIAGEEKAREYLENEMEKVKKLKEDIIEALEKSKSSN